MRSKVLKVRLVFSIAVVVAAVFLTSSQIVAASTRSGNDQRAPIELAHFSLRASGGFTAVVDGSGHFVILTLTRQSRRQVEVAEYAVRGRASTNGLRARFGHRGFISVAFQPTGTAKHVAPPEGCNGSYVRGETGTFSGTIRFAGEGGYVTLHAHGAKGRAARSKYWSCPHRHGVVSLRRPSLARMASSPEEEGEAHEYAKLLAQDSGQRFFQAVGGPVATSRRAGLPVFLAASAERHGSMTILREMGIRGQPTDFTFDDRLQSALVQPPAPFQGSGTFQRGPGNSKTWSGTLGVSLPGADGVSLVGPRFEAKLSHNLPGD